MMPKGKLGRGKVFEGWGSYHANHSNHTQQSGITMNPERLWKVSRWRKLSKNSDCFLYRWLGYACWQWCSWPRWWLHTPILRGPPCWGTETVSCRWGGCCAYSCLASPPSMESTATWLRSGNISTKAEEEIVLRCVYGTFLQVMIGISGSPEAAQGITSSLPASWRYSPPGLTLK